MAEIGRVAIVDAGGLSVALDAEPGLTAVAARLLEDLEAGSGEPRATVVLRRAAPPLPAREPDIVTPIGLDVWWEGERVVLALGAVVAIAGRGRAEIGGEAHDADRRMRSLLPLALMHLLAPLGRFIVHAAAVARHDRALLVLGPSGSGKSTVAAAALAAGWSVLADDLSVVRAAAGGPALTGVPRALAVPEEALAALSTDAFLDGADHRGRLQLPSSVLTPGWLPVAGTVFVGHGREAASTLETRPGDAVLRGLLRSTLLVGERGRLGAFYPVAGHIARRPGADLQLGTDVLTRVEGVQRLLARLLSQGGPAPVPPSPA